MNELTITKTLIKTGRAIISFKNVAHISWKEDRKYKAETGNDELFYAVRIYSNAETIRQIMNNKEFVKLLANYTNWVNSNE